MRRTPKTEEEVILDRLAAIHKRMSEIAEMEANAAPVGGMAARGIFEDEKDRHIAETDELLDRLKQIGGTIPFEFK